MTGQRGWHVAVVATAVVLGALSITTADSPVQLSVALGALSVFVIAWFWIGADADRSEARSIAMSVVLIAVGTAGTVAIPAFATFQTIAYPMLWTRARGLRQALSTNIALAVGIGIGLFLASGADTAALVQAVIIQAISLSFSIALGLWITQIADRSEERQRLLDELRATQDQLAAVNRDAGVASERERLAREIHDTIAQDLTGLVLLAQRAQRELQSDDPGAAAETLGTLEDGARTTLAETRALVAATAPVSLAAGGLGEALARLGERFQRETGTPVEVTAAGLPPLDRDTEVVLLRCTQEGLANVRKHARAATASVTLTTQEGEAVLTIQDDGTGIPVDAAPGFGLAGMRDRLALVGGTLEVESSPRGTRLRVAVPLRVAVSPQSESMRSES
jgi:signal transduction histidine kinase